MPAPPAHPHILLSYIFYPFNIPPKAAWPSGQKPGGHAVFFMCPDFPYAFPFVRITELISAVSGTDSITPMLLEILLTTSMVRYAELMS